MLQFRLLKSNFRIKNHIRNISSDCPIQYLEHLFHDSARNVISNAPKNFSPKLSHYSSKRAGNPENVNFDYQSNIAVQFGNSMKVSPKQVGEKIKAQIVLKDFENGIQHLNVSENGFMEIALEPEWLADRAYRMSTSGVRKRQHGKCSKRILVDFASPNMGKELHVGHMRSGVIGDSICRILEFNGHKVTRVSHVGDLGSAVATLISHLGDEVQVGNVDLQHLPTPKDLGQLYIDSKRKLKSDPEFAYMVNRVVYALQYPDSKLVDINQDTVTALWHFVCRASRVGFDSVWKKLGVSVQERGESTYRPFLDDTVRNLKKQGIVKVSNGANCIFVDGDDKPPMLIQKTDGGFLYATTDLACMRHRLFYSPCTVGSGHGYDQILYVTDQTQHHHFRQLFKAGQMAGWYSSENCPLEHISFGIVRGEDGQRLKSRDGTPLSLDKLLDQSLVEARNNASDLMKRVPIHEQNKSLESIAYGAVRYYELAQNRNKDYTFSFNKALSTKGNTSVYLMYATARLQSILEKYNASGLRNATWSDVTNNTVMCTLSAPSERKLAVQICDFQSVLRSAERLRSPHLLCDYLYKVSSAFHQFYEACPVLKAKDPIDTAQRLKLCGMTNSVLQTGMQIVGLKPVKAI